MNNNEAIESNEEVDDLLIVKQERKSVLWRCSKGFGAGQYHHEPCGKINAIWTIFDPMVGGNRKKRWLGHCKYCPKVTAINPEANNIVGVKKTRQEGIEEAERMNAHLERMKASREALTREEGVVADE